MHELQSKRREVIERLWHLGDANADETIDLEEFAAMNGVKEMDEQHLRILVLLDLDKNRKLVKQEMIEGLNQMVKVRMVDRSMALDGDGDDKLSLKEFALSMPDPKAKADESGFTKRQVEFFRQNDVNADGSVTRPELMLTASRSMNDAVRATVSTIQAFRHDKNADGILSLQEFKDAFAGPPSHVAAAELGRRHEAWSKSEDKEPGLSRDELEHSLRRLSFVEPRAFETIIALAESNLRTEQGIKE